MENYKTNSVNKYSEEDAVRYYSDLKKRLEHDNRFYIDAPEYTPQAYTPTDAYLKDYLANYTREDLHRKADALIEKQNLNRNDEFIDHMSTKNLGDYNHFRSQWSPVAIQAREYSSEKTVKVGNKVVYTHDLSFSIAETMELQDASQDPVTEYYDWLKIQARIENDIYTNGTTPSEIKARNFFIDHMNNRESELKRIISLYSETAFNSNSALQNIAQEKLKFLTFKLSELRRLRDRTASTKAQADRPEQDIQPQNTNETVKRVKPIMDIEPIQQPVNNIEITKAKNDDITRFMVDRHFKELTETNIGLMYANLRAQKALTAPVSSNAELRERILRGLRNGMSKEELMREEARNEIPLHEKDIDQVYIQHLRGFDIAAYQKAVHKRTA